jgi:hypothetical protein
VRAEDVVLLVRQGPVRQRLAASRLERRFGGGEAHAFPPVHYDDLAPVAESATAAPSHEEPAATPPSIWDEQPPTSPGWDDGGSSTQQHAGAGGFSAAASSFAEPPADDSSPFANEAHEEHVSPAVPAYSAEPAPPSWSSGAGSAEHEPAGDIGEPAGHELSEQQIDRIARRVVQLMSDQLVRNIAWEVIPDLAEMVVKERVRQLEADEN